MKFTSTLKNGYHGKSVETNISVNGYDWSISTSKRSNGILSCSAQGGTDKNGCFTFAMMGDPRISLATQAGTATEKKLFEVHNLGLLKFQELYDAGELPKRTELKAGQVVLNPDHSRYVVITDEKEAGGQKCLNLQKTENFEAHTLQNWANIDDELRPWKLTEETLTPEQLAQVLEDFKAFKVKGAQEATQAQNTRKEQEAKARQAYEAAKPSWAKALIIAKLEENNSDLMSDYHSSRTVRSVALAWSAHERNDFNEMRKAALNFDDTKHLADDSEEGKKKLEHRENYSMGSGYYLAEYKYSGWQIKKVRAGEFDSWYHGAFADPENIKITEQEQPKEKPAPVEVTPGKVQIIDYSEKAVAVIGETYPIREKLKELGGRFNRNLSCGAGWIFSKKQLPELQKAFSKPNEETKPETFIEKSDGEEIVRFKEIPQDAPDRKERLNNQLDQFSKEADAGKLVCISDLFGNAGM